MLLSASHFSNRNKKNKKKIKKKKLGTCSNSQPPEVTDCDRWKISQNQDNSNSGSNNNDV